jgi:hypothetical protein
MAAARRAPRLGPEDSIAMHFTRLGRFSRIDPRKTPDLPRIPKILGVLGWAALVVESLRRARAAVTVESQGPV